MNRKRFRAFLLAVSFFVVTVVPVRHAQAVVPLAVGMTLQAIGTGGAVLSADLLTAVGSALIGGTIVALGITPSALSDGTTPTPARVATTTDAAKTAAAMPAPSVPASTATVGGIPTSNWPSYTVYQRCNDPTDCGVSYPLLSSCLSGFAVASPRYCRPVDSNTGLPFTSNGQQVGYTGGAYAVPSGVVSGDGTCGAGYTSSGSGCTLSNARAAQSDNKADFGRDSTGVISLGDVDQSKATYIQSGTGTITAWGNGSDGQPRVITIAKNVSGDTVVTVQAQLASASGDSLVSTRTFTIAGSSGVVSAYSGTTSTGTIALPGTVTGSGATTTPTVTTGTSVTGTNTVPDQQSIQFPTDYARTGEAASAAGSVNAHVDQVKDAVNKLSDTTGASQADPVVPAASEFDSLFFHSTFDGIMAWRLPSHQSQCPTPVFNLDWGHGYTRSYTMDAHCTIAEDVRPSMSVVMVVFWICAALFIVLGA